MSVTPYQRFAEALQSPSKRQNYTTWFNQFCEYSKCDPDSLVSLNPKEFSDLVFQYLVHLKMRAEKGEISPNSIRPMTAPIKLFCVQNDINVNFKKLSNILPRPVAPKNQGAYTDEDIKKLLEHTTSYRNKAIIHFLASTGVRIEAVSLLNYGDIEPIEDGAMVWIYQGDIERYRTFLTPEACKALSDYLKFRELNGCIPTKEDDPIFCKRNHRDRILLGGIKQIIPHIMVNAGIRGKKAERKISSKSPNHAFRKRFENILINSDIPSKYIETLCGSYETGRDKHYVRNTVTKEQLWNQFKKAIPMLTIDKTEQISISHKLEKQEITESFQAEYKEKIENLEDQLGVMTHMFASRVYLSYEQLYGNNLEEMKKKMSDEEIDEWNMAILHPKINKPELKIQLTQSERTMKQIKGIREWKKFIEEVKKKGASKENVDYLEEIGEEIAKESGLSAIFKNSN